MTGLFGHFNCRAGLASNICIDDPCMHVLYVKRTQIQRCLIDKLSVVPDSLQYLLDFPERLTLGTFLAEKMVDSRAF